MNIKHGSILTSKTRDLTLGLVTVVTRDSSLLHHLIVTPEILFAPGYPLALRSRQQDIPINFGVPFLFDRATARRNESVTLGDKIV